MKIVVFGCGRVAASFLKIVSENTNIIGFSDNNRNMHGKEFFDKPVMPPQDLRGIDFDYIVVASGFYESILEQLVKLMIDRSKILLFTGSRSPADVDWANDSILKKLLVKCDKDKIGLAIAKPEEGNTELAALCTNIPLHIKEKYLVECFDYERKHDFGVVIHQSLGCIQSYLTSVNIALWQGLSYDEIYQVRDMPAGYIAEGAYLHGVNAVMMYGNYEKNFPCVFWDIEKDELTVLGVPVQQQLGEKMPLSAEGQARLIYIPRPGFKQETDEETDVYQPEYNYSEIEEFISVSTKIKEQGIEPIIALPEMLINETLTKSMKVVSLGSPEFSEEFSRANIVVTDSSFSGLEYTLSKDKVIHLVSGATDDIVAKDFKFTGYGRVKLAALTTSAHELGDLALRLLENGDEYFNVRKSLTEELGFADDSVLPFRLWHCLASYLQSYNLD